MKTTKLDMLYITCITLSPICFIIAPFIAKHNIKVGICLLAASIMGAATAAIFNHFDK